MKRCSISCSQLLPVSLLFLLDFKIIINLFLRNSLNFLYTSYLLKKHHEEVSFTLFLPSLCMCWGKAHIMMWKTSLTIFRCYPAFEAFRLGATSFKYQIRNFEPTPGYFPLIKASRGGSVQSVLVRMSNVKERLFPSSALTAHGWNRGTRQLYEECKTMHRTPGGLAQDSLCPTDNRIPGGHMV